MEQIDINFGDMAVESGLATGEQVDECMEAVRKAREFGAMTSLADTMVGKKYLSRSQADGLLARLRGGRGASGADAKSDAKLTALGGYEVIEKLGGGGAGVVYKARQVAMDRIVALKLLRPSLSRDEVFVERFFREARTAAKLNHPNIVQAIDAGFDKGFHYLVMEFVDGPTLAQHLKQWGPLGEEEALKITRDVAAALAHVERLSIVHRDIKPDNIMLTKEGAAKLADLGIAKSYFSDSAVTLEGNAVGTPFYMSPEQARGEALIDVRSDIYSLGATLFHMVTGTTPFAGDTPAIVLSKRLVEPPPNPRTRRSDISIATSNLIMQMMATDPAQRFPTAQALVDVIDAVMRHEAAAVKAPVIERPVQPVIRRSPRGQGPRSQGRDGAAPSLPKKKAATALIAGGTVAVAILLAIIFVATRESTASRAEKAFNACVAYWQSRPDDPEGALARFESVKTTCNDPTWASRATAEAEKIRKYAAALAAEREFSVLKNQCVALVSKNRFGEADRMALDFMKKHANEAVAGDASKLKDTIESTAQAQFDKLMAAADAALAEKDYAKARDALKPVESFGVAMLTQRAAKKIAEVESREKDAAQWAKWEEVKSKVQEMTDAAKFDEARKLLELAGKLPLPGIADLVREQQDTVEQAVAADAEAALKKFSDAFDEKVRPLLAARDYAGAQKLFDEIAQQDAVKRAPEQAEPLRIDIRRLKQFWPSAAQKAETLKAGQKITIGGKEAKLVSCKGGTLRYRFGTAETTTEVREMNAREAADLLDPTDDEGRLQAAACLLYDRDADPTRAFRLLRKARKSDDVNRYLEMARSMGAKEDAEEVAVAPTPGPKNPAKPTGLVLPKTTKIEWQSMFNGKSLKGWEPVGPNQIYLQTGNIIIEEGSYTSGIAWKGDFPTEEYEVMLDAMRISWYSTFCGLVFPVGDEYYTLKVGSTPGRVTLENPRGTSSMKSTRFFNDRWYRIRLAVSKERIAVWVDQQKLIDAAIIKRESSMRYYSSYREELRPFGIFTEDAKSGFRNIGYRKIPAAEPAK